MRKGLRYGDVKILLPCTLAALILGVLGGWWLKPETRAEVPSGDGGKLAKAEQRATGMADIRTGESEGEPKKAGMRGPREAKGRLFSPDAKEAMKRMRASMEDRHAKRMEARIADLVAKLGLNPQQEARLRAHFEGLKPDVAIDTEDGGVRVNAKQAMSPKEQAESLDKLMEEMLTPDQQEAYAASKETERNQRVEARTLRDMASLTQAVTLREDQRDAVYEILQNEARSQVDQAGGAGMQATGVFMNADFAAPAGAEATVMQMNMGPIEEGMGQEQMMERAREQESARIDAQVERLNGVLDAAQLAAYRRHLEQGSMLIGP